MILVSVLFFCSAADAAAQRRGVKLSPSGKTVNFELALADFNGISVWQGIEVQAAQSDKYSVVVQTDQAAEDYLDILVENGVLRIKYTKNVRSQENIQTIVYVTMPELTLLNASSSSKIIGKGTFTGTSLAANATSSSKIDIAVNYSSLALKTSSSSAVTVTGRATICSVSSSSSSKININGAFECDKFTASSSSSSKITVENLTATALSASSSSSSLITLAGESDSGVFSASSSSKIEAKEMELYTAEATASSSSLMNINVSSSLTAKATSSGKIYVFGGPLSIDSTTSSSGVVVEKK